MYQFLHPQFVYGFVCVYLLSIVIGFDLRLVIFECTFANEFVWINIRPSSCVCMCQCLFLLHQDLFLCLSILVSQFVYDFLNVCEIAPTCINHYQANRLCLSLTILLYNQSLNLSLSFCDWPCLCTFSSFNPSMFVCD